MDLQIDLTQADIEAQRLPGRVTYRASPRAGDGVLDPAGVRVLQLNSAGLEIRGVQLVSSDAHTDTNYPVLRYRVSEPYLLIDLGRRYRPGEEFNVRIAFVARPQPEALYFVRPDDDHPKTPTMIYTMSEPLLAHHWFPCHDWPDTRWPSDIHIHVPEPLSAVSIGEPVGEPVDHGDGTRTFHWRQTVPTDPHLIGLAIGELTTLDFGAWRERPVRAYVLPSFEEAGRFTFRRVPEMIDYYSTLLGVDFPLPCYAHVSVAEHFHGGMEHAGFSMIAPTMLTTGPRGDVPEDWSQYNYIAHMLAHMWFGGLVNYHDLRDAWLNEGFATYLDHLWRKRTESDEAFDDLMYSAACSLARYDVSGRDKPLRREELGEADEVYEYDGSKVYTKGSWVLHMLRHQLGEATFWHAVGDYLTHCTSGSALTGEFQKAMERATGVDLGLFFDQWVHRDGLPRLDIECAWDNAAHQARLTIRQRQLIDDRHPQFRFPLDVWLRANGEWHKQTVEVTEPTDTETIPLPCEPDLFCTDPLGGLLAARKERKPIAMWLRQVSEGPTALTRSVAIEYLAAQGDEESVSSLRDCLLATSESPRVRRRAARALGKVRSEAALSALLEAARMPWDDANTCAAVLNSLSGWSASPDAYRAIRPYLTDDRPIIVQAAAISAVSEFDGRRHHTDVVGTVAHAALRPMSRYVRQAAISALQRMKDPRALGVMALPAETDPDDTLELRQKLIDLVGTLAAANPSDRTGAVKFLLAQLDDSRPTIRAAALRSLGAVGDDDVADKLRGRAEDGKEEVRKALTEALEAIERRVNADPA